MSHIRTDVETKYLRPALHFISQKYKSLYFGHLSFVLLRFVVAGPGWRREKEIGTSFLFNHLETYIVELL